MQAGAAWTSGLNTAAERMALISFWPIVGITSPNPGDISLCLKAPGINNLYNANIGNVIVQNLL
jgi:hypothetical protein